MRIDVSSRLNEPRLVLACAYVIHTGRLAPPLPPVASIPVDALAPPSARRSSANWCLPLLFLTASNTEMLSDHVLGEFSRTEKRELDNVIADACDAVEHWIEEEDMAKVMTRFNSAR